MSVSCPMHEPPNEGIDLDVAYTIPCPSAGEYLIDGSTIYIPDQQESSAFAFDIRTGSILWKTTGIFQERNKLYDRPALLNGKLFFIESGISTNYSIIEIDAQSGAMERRIYYGEGWSRFGLLAYDNAILPSIDGISITHLDLSSLVPLEGGNYSATITTLYRLPSDNPTGEKMIGLHHRILENDRLYFTGIH